MVTNILSINEIVSDPKIHDGKPIIIGSTIKVSDVALLRTTGNHLLPPQIAEYYHLSLAQIHAALAYYYLHQAEIDEEIRCDVKEADSE